MFYGQAILRLFHPFPGAMGAYVCFACITIRDYSNDYPEKEDPLCPPTPAKCFSFKCCLEFLHFYPTKHFVISETSTLNSWKAKWAWHLMLHWFCNSSMSKHVHKASRVIHNGHIYLKDWRAFWEGKNSSTHTQESTSSSLVQEQRITVDCGEVKKRECRPKCLLPRLSFNTTFMDISLCSRLKGLQ